MTSAHPVRVALIGCGLIGSQWDADRADSAHAATHSLTHARAFSRHPGSCLVACCDTDLAMAERAARQWGGSAYADPHTLFAEQDIDLAVVASTSSARADVVMPALAAGVKTLVIEKPLATTLDESLALVAACEVAGARTLVNYSRHWDPSMLNLRRRWQAGEFGAVQRLLGSYGKGLSNNGSHLIDLARSLSSARPMRARSLGSPLPESESRWSSGADRALDAQVELIDADGRVLCLDMRGTDQSAFTCFELRLIGREAMLDISQGGRRIEMTDIQPDPNYPGYRIPGSRQALPAHALQAMDRMADEAVALAAGRLGQSSCDARNALTTAITVAAIRQSDIESGRWVDIEA